MNKRLLVFLLLSLSLPLFANAQAQTTSVTVSVTDAPDGQVWANGSFTTALGISQGQSSGTSSPGPSGTLDASGHATFSLTSINDITFPTGGLWQVFVCPQMGCAAAQFGISLSSPQVVGPSASYTITPPSFRIQATQHAGAIAYRDSEVVSSTLGSVYFNVTSSQLKFCGGLPCSVNWVTGAGVSVPSGTGYTHIASGTQDPAAKLLNLTASTDVAANQGTASMVLHGNGSGQPNWGAVALGIDVSGQLPIGNVGSTGLSGTSPISVSTTGAISCPTCGTATGTVSSASFTGGLVSIATPTTTPAFTVAGTSGGIPYFSAANTWASSAALTANALVEGGGAGVGPSASSVTDAGAGVQIGSPTGGAKGAGTINTSGLYVNGVAALTTPPQQSWYLSRNCGNSPNCTQVFADGHYVIDATSNSSTTITCPNSDCNFTSTDFFGNPVMKTGQKIWATTQGSTPGIGFLIYTTFVCPVSTVSSFTANSVTMANACTANGTANVALYWGDDDGTALHGLDSTVGCSTVYLPDPGPNNLFILDSRGFFTTAPSTSTCNQNITTSVGAPAPALVGSGTIGASSSAIMITPDATWGDAKACTNASQNVFIGCTTRGMSQIQFLGSGLTSASNANCPTNLIILSSSPASSTIYGVDMAGICPGASGVEGIELNNFDVIFEGGGVQSTGQYACAAYKALGMVTRGDDCRNDNVTGGYGLLVKGGAVLSDYSTYPFANILINGNSTLQSHGSHIGCGNPHLVTTGIEITSGSTWVSQGDYVGVDTGETCSVNGLLVDSGGLVQSSSTQYKSTAVAGTGAINNAGTFVSLGGNKVVQGIPVTSSGGVWKGLDVLTASCQGTPSVQTNAFYPYGTATGPLCNQAISSTNPSGFPVNPAGSQSVLSLAVTAVTSGSATFNVVKCHNGTCSNTTLTCAMSSASFCSDSTHFDSPANGDTYAIDEVCAASCPVNVSANLLMVW